MPTQHERAIVFIVAKCCSFKLRSWSCGNYWSDEFLLYVGHHLLIPRLPTNTDTVCWGKATIAREPSNEHDYSTFTLS